MSNIAVIRQGSEDIQVWDNFGQAQNVPLRDGKIIEDELELLEYVIDYAQGLGCETLVDILDSVCEQGYKMIINTIPYTNEQIMPSFTKMGFWE